MLKNLGQAFLVAVVALFLGVSLAYATEGDGDAAIGGGGIDFGAKDPGTGSGNAYGGGGRNGNGNDNAADEIGDIEKCEGTALECARLDPITQPVDPEAAAPATPDAAQLAQSAKGRIDFKAPRIGLSPIPPSPALVNLQTWLWLDAIGWAPLEGSVTAGDTTVTATARPVSVRWNMGEGLKVCQGPGTPWRKGLGQNAKTTCGFTYRHTSVGQPGGAFRISATVMYDSSWTCEGECTEDGGDLGMLPSPAAATNLRVTERQTVVE